MSMPPTVQADIDRQLTVRPWYGHRAALLVLTLGTAVTLVAFLLTSRIAARSLDDRFEADMTMQTEVVSTVLRRHLDDLEVLHRYATVTPDLSPDAFRQFVRPWLGDTAGRAMFWAPVVDASERERYETWARGLGLLADGIRERDAAGRFVAASARSRFVPLTYVEPDARRGPLAGFDLLSEPMRAATLDRSARTRAPASTASLELIDPQIAGRAVIVAIAVFDATEANRFGPGRPDGPTSFVATVIRLHDVLIDALGALRPAHRLHFEIRDEMIDGDGGLLWSDPDAMRATRWPGLGTGTHRTAVKVADRRWTITVSPSIGYVSEHHRRWPLAVLLTGLLLTLAVGFAFGRTASARDEAEALVVERTAALRESEARWHFALEGAGDGVWDWNVETNEVFFSSQWKRMLGFDDHEIGGSLDEWKTRVHPDDLSGVVERLEAHFRGQTSVYESEHRVRRKDGSWAWILDRGRIVSRRPDGHPLRIVGTHTDLTDRKAADEARLELERQRLSAHRFESLGTLAGGVAHDFNNMLTIIVGHLDLVRMDLPFDHPAQGSIAEAREAADRATDLSAKMLAYSGRGRLSHERLDISAIIGQETRLIEAAVGDAARVDVRLSPTAAVFGDRRQIVQLVVALVTNAAEAIIDVPGLITVTTGTTMLDEAELGRNAASSDPLPGCHAFIDVSDTGAGFGDDVRRRIFDPFFSTKFTGRGLGLAVVDGIVRGHRGAVFVDSELGRGTSIRVLLPGADVV